MIVKFFRHGTGGGSAVFDYLLGKDGDRPDAEILRGDVEQQKLLIDSLEFKRQYTSGCLSFEEAPDHLTLKQKNEIMDSFEEPITAGLEVDRTGTKGGLSWTLSSLMLILSMGDCSSPIFTAKTKRGSMRGKIYRTLNMTYQIQMTPYASD